jgi:hypothetical protein
MGNEDNKWDKMIIGMIKATNKRDLTWDIFSFAADKSDLETKYDVYYLAILESQKFRLYSKRYKDYRGPTYRAMSTALSVFNAIGKSFDPDPNEKIWHSQICLDIINSEGVVVYQISGVRPLFELLELAKEQSSGINELKKRFEDYQ